MNHQLYTKWQTKIVPSTFTITAYYNQYQFAPATNLDTHLVKSWLVNLRLVNATSWLCSACKYNHSDMTWMYWVVVRLKFSMLASPLITWMNLMEKCCIPPGGTTNLGLSQIWSLTQTSTAHDSSSACHAKCIYNSMFICLVISQSNLFVWENSSEVTVRFDLGCRIATAASQFATCTMYFAGTDILTQTFECQISVFCIKPWESEHVQCPAVGSAVFSLCLSLDHSLCTRHRPVVRTQSGQLFCTPAPVSDGLFFSKSVCFNGFQRCFDVNEAKKRVCGGDRQYEGVSLTEGGWKEPHMFACKAVWTQQRPHPRERRAAFCSTFLLCTVSETSALSLHTPLTFLALWSYPPSHCNYSSCMT